MKKINQGGALRATPRHGAKHPRSHLGWFAGHPRGGGGLRATSSVVRMPP
jgi:hypothetical protein